MQCTACLQDDPYCSMDDNYMYCGPECFKMHFWMHRRGASSTSSPFGTSPTATLVGNGGVAGEAHGVHGVRLPSQQPRPAQLTSPTQGGMLGGLNAKAAVFRKGRV